MPHYKDSGEYSQHNPASTKKAGQCRTDIDMTLPCRIAVARCWPDIPWWLGSFVKENCEKNIPLLHPLPLYLFLSEAMTGPAEIFHVSSQRHDTKWGVPTTEEVMIASLTDRLSGMDIDKGSVNICTLNIRVVNFNVFCFIERYGCT